MGIRCSVETGKVKPSLSNWISERTTFLESISLFHFARCVFAKTKIFSEASFPALLAEQFIAFKIHFWDCLNFEFLCLIEFGGTKISFRCQFAKEKYFNTLLLFSALPDKLLTVFKQNFFKSPLKCLFIAGWVRGVKPSFASNLRMNDLFGKFFSFKTVCD